MYIRKLGLIYANLSQNVGKNYANEKKNRLLYARNMEIRSEVICIKSHRVDRHHFS